jgi:hypothetical protein
VSRRRLLAWALVGAATAVVFAAVGLSEGHRFEDRQQRGIAATVALIGPLDAHEPTIYRQSEGLTCLIYERSKRPYGLEVCVDGRGRVIEAANRLGDATVFWTLVRTPDEAELRVDRTLVDRLVKQVDERRP